MSKKIDEFNKLNKLISELPREKSGEIAHFIESKLELLKICYEKSTDVHYQKQLKIKIKHPRLKAFITGDIYRGKSVEIDSIAYDKKTIEGHIDDGLPEQYNSRGIEIYNFYFGGYRKLFSCFSRNFLRKVIEIEKSFLEDIFSQNYEDLELSNESIDNGLRKELNNVPDLEIENYVPRISILEEIFNLFEQKNKKINITGISGNGKTFLARHFVQHYSEIFSHIVWLNCSEGLSKAFTEGKGAKLLDKIGLSSEHLSFVNGNMKVESLIEMLFGRLQMIKENSILVLDNLSEEILFYEDELNLFSNWKILTTSQESLDGFYNYAIPSFEDEALNLFYKYYTLESDDDNLIRLLSSVEYHTLTIELLAKTAQQRQITIIELVNRFIENGINVVEKISIIADHNIERKNKVERKTKIENIEEYLNIVFDTSVLSEEECKILLNIAILQTEPIEINLFKEVYLNDSTDNKTLDIFEHNISILSIKGWIQIESGRIKIHSLVKVIVTKRFLYRKDFFNSTIDYLGKVLKTDTQNNLKKKDYLTMAESLLESYREIDKDTTYLRKGISILFNSMGLHEKAINIWHELEETDNINETITKYHNLAIISMNQGKHNEAQYYSNKVHSLLDDSSRIELCLSIKKTLTSFLKSIKVKISSDFENNLDLIVLLQVLDMILSCHTLVTIYDKNKDELEKIKGLKKIVSIQNQILSIFEKNISQDVLFSIRIYKEIFLRKDSFLRYIGELYIKLKEYIKAEESLKSLLPIKEAKMNNEHISLLQSYHDLIVLYLHTEKIEDASFYLEKSRIICKELPSNNPYNILFNKDKASIEKLIQEKGLLENLNNDIELEFEALFKRSQNSTILGEYYFILSNIYYEYKNIEKAREYNLKEINFLSNLYEDYNQLVNSYIRLSICDILLGLFEEATKSYNIALNLYLEKNVNNEETYKRLSQHNESLTKCAIQSSYIPFIKTVINFELATWQNGFNYSTFELSQRNKLSNILQGIFIFLLNLPDLEKTIEEQEYTNDGMVLFLSEYNNLVIDLDKEYIKTYAPKIEYRILDEYYQIFIKTFFVYENWRMALKYSLKRLFLNEKYYEIFNDQGRIHYIISYCYFKLRNFELALEKINKAIIIYNKASEKASHDKTIGQIKNNLKEALVLQASINEELKKYRR